MYFLFGLIYVGFSIIMFIIMVIIIKKKEHKKRDILDFTWKGRGNWLMLHNMDSEDALWNSEDPLGSLLAFPYPFVKVSGKWQQQKPETEDSDSSGMKIWSSRWLRTLTNWGPSWGCKILELEMEEGNCKHQPQGSQTSQVSKF